MSLATPAYCRPAAFEAFRRELPGADSPVGLLRTTTAISLHAEPEHDIDAVVSTVERLSHVVQRRLKSDSQEAAVAHLHDVLFDVIGFRGAAAEKYYEPANSYVPRVLESRRGIPITLVLVYRAVAAPLGLRVEGINAPGHFLAAVRSREALGEQTQYVDPFHSGALLSLDEAVARIEATIGQPLPLGVDPLPVATPQAWLNRMLTNLQAIFARSQQERDLLAMQELQALLAAES
ncbi:MAG: transglutaminase-like domain-containing protein [Planctomycetota bacterium]